MSIAPTSAVKIPVVSVQSQIAVSKAPGHWVLARLGKRVLRPGGLFATRVLLDALRISKLDHVVEFAPGLGVTAEMIEARWPASYTGVDRELPAVERLRKNLSGSRKVVHASAEQTGLPSDSADKLVGEAMLSMHPMVTKERIISEAHRVLKTDGLYGIHELALTDELLSDEARKELRHTMSQAIHNGVTPLTTSEWCRLLKKQGFQPEKVTYVSFELLDPKRLVADEGLLGALRFGFNLLRNREARKRVLKMRQTFMKYREHLSAILIVARKIEA